MIVGEKASFHFFLQGGEVAYNKVENCFSVGIYTDTSRDIYMHSNFVYATTSKFDRPDSKHSFNAFSISTEYYPETENKNTDTPSNIIIANNIMVNTGQGINDWRDDNNKKQSNSYNNVHIYYNVVIGNEDISLAFSQVPNGWPVPTGCSIANNIFYKGNSSGNDIWFGNPDAWTFANNNWVNGIPSEVKRNNDFTADPQFVAPVISSGPEGFALKPTSSTLQKGVPVSITVDYWGKARSNSNPTPGIWEP